MPDPADPARLRRGTTVLLTGVIAMAFVGYVAGLVGSGRGEAERVIERVGPSSTTPGAHDADDDVADAVSYADLRDAGLGPNRDLVTRLADYEPPRTDLFDVATPAPADKRASLDDRATRRAYNGAPPVVPHAIDQVGAASCLACHAQTMRVGERRASKIPHPVYTSCTQCHVEQRSATPGPGAGASPAVDNGFVGLPAPFEGARAGVGAPPVIPHSTLMRTDCLSCHGPDGPSGLQTTHPWRQSCLQCHAPSATLEQSAVAGEPVLLLPPPVVDAP